MAKQPGGEWMDGQVSALSITSNLKRGGLGYKGLRAAEASVRPFRRLSSPMSSRCLIGAVRHSEIEKMTTDEAVEAATQAGMGDALANAVTLGFRDAAVDVLTKAGVEADAAQEAARQMIADQSLVPDVYERDPAARVLKS